MIFILSLIIGFGSLILCPIIFILNDYSIGFTILYTILIFLVIIFLFCLLIVSLLPIVGNHFAKTYNPHDKKDGVLWLISQDFLVFGWELG